MGYELNREITYIYKFVCDNCGKEQAVKETLDGKKVRIGDIEDLRKRQEIKIPSNWFYLSLFSDKNKTTGVTCEQMITCSKACCKELMNKEIDIIALKNITEGN